MKQRTRRQPRSPFGALQQRTFRKRLWVADAKISNRNDVPRNAEDAPERVVSHDTDPSDTQPLRTCREPEIPNRETGRIDLDLRDTDLAQHARSKAVGLARHDQVERRVKNPFELERQELLLALTGEPLGVLPPLLLEDAHHFAPALEVAHDDEVPRLRESDARRMMCRDQHAREHLIGHRVGDELADIAPPEDRLVQAALKLGRERMPARLGRLLDFLMI